MKALLDTNIIIHRETHRVLSKDIGVLFKWLDKGRYAKCIHQVTIQEIRKNLNKDTVASFNVKLQSYEELVTVAPMADAVKVVSGSTDKNQNDINDSILLNEVFCGRVDLLITEDKKIHDKARALDISERVFTINSFLEKVVSENPTLIDYKVLSVTKKHFGEIDLKDSFFDSFREDYKGFDKWFHSKANEVAYVTHNKGNVLSFLYLKVEGIEENYSEISPTFKPLKRLKIGTFKVVSNGVRLGERFLKIVFDNAIQYRVNEIYVTIFEKRDEQKRLIALLEEWGFFFFGKKNGASGEELVYVRQFTPSFLPGNPRITFPYISRKSRVFLAPIHPPYHTELLPDSILRNESPLNFVENEPHRNAISKAYISRSIERNLKRSDLLVFYRTGGKYTSVVTTIGIVESTILTFSNVDEFILKNRKRSIFSDEELKKWWDYKPNFRPFIVNFLSAYSFPKKPNLEKLIELQVIKDIGSAPRGFTQISLPQFNAILKESESDPSIIVD